MKCSNCGEEVKDGSIYCEYCGADIMDAVVLDSGSLDKVKEYEKQKKQKEKELQRELLKKQEAIKIAEREERRKNRVPFYENPASYRICAAAEFFSAAIMLLIPVFHWVWVRIKDIENTYYSRFSLWDLCKAKEPAAIIISVFFVLNGLVMLYFAAKDNIRKIKIPDVRVPEFYRFLFRLLPIAVGVLLIIIFTHTAVYERTYQNYMELQLSFQSQIDIYRQFNGTIRGMSSKMGHGSAFWGVFISIALYIFSQCFKFILDTLNEDDEEA